MLQWSHGKDAFYAASCIHDDGSPFLYEFKRTAEGWQNHTEAELIDGPTCVTFATAEAAKAWAERTETKWRKADFA